MEHFAVKAATQTTTDQGTFTALASTYSEDRGGDVVEPGAFGGTIARWKQSGKQIPLHWNHQSDDPADIIGTVDPASMQETPDGLVVEGKLDLEDSAKAREAWRLVKADSIGVSFGYLSESQDGADGTRLLTSIDLFELSLTPSPMNADTRVLAWKSAGIPAFTDSDWEGIRQAGAKAKAAHEERQRKDAELKHWIADLKAKAAWEAKRNRPITVRRFKVG